MVEEEKKKAEKGSVQEPHKHLLYEEVLFRYSVISNVSYTIGIQLSRDHTFKGNTVIECDLAEVSPLLFLDFFSGDISRLLFNNTEVDPKTVQKANRIYWPIANQIKGKNIIVVTYKIPHARHINGVRREATDRNNYYFYTQFEPFAANRVYPCFDQPDIKAYFQLVMFAPIEWITITNEYEETLCIVGEGSYSSYLSKYRIQEAFIEKDRESKMLMTIFKKTAHKLCSYLFHFSTGDFVKFEGPYEKNLPPLRMFLREERVGKYKDVMQELLGYTRLGMIFYQDFLGVPYPFEKYDTTFVTDFEEVAMENAACTTMCDSLLKPNQKMRLTYLMMHELAHHWFGDYVSIKWWSHLWLNEGFATYMGRLCQDKVPSLRSIGNPFALVQRRKKDLYRSTKEHPLVTKINKTKKILSIFDDICYEKGGAVLKQLMHSVGEDAFKKGLNAYLEKFKWGNATTSDLLTSLKPIVEPAIKVDEWERDWVNTVGVNLLKAEFTIKDGKIESFWVEQFQFNTLLRTHTINIALIREGSYEEIQRVKINPEAKTDIPSLVGKEAICAAVANSGDYGYCTIALNLVSKQYLNKRKEEIQKVIPDPLTAKLVIHCLKDDNSE